MTLRTGGRDKHIPNEKHGEEWKGRKIGGETATGHPRDPPHGLFYKTAMGFISLRQRACMLENLDDRSGENTRLVIKIHFHKDAFFISQFAAFQKIFFSIEDTLPGTLPLYDSFLTPLEAKGP